MSKERHYYKIKVHRYPPYYPINKDYYKTEYVWGYTQDGAENSFYRYHKDSYGDNVAEEFEEITKEEYYSIPKYDRIN